MDKNRSMTYFEIERRHYGIGESLEHVFFLCFCVHFAFFWDLGKMR